MRGPRGVALVLLLAGGALAASGCSAPEPWVPPRPEAFTAVYEYQLSWGDRHGVLNVSLAGPADLLGRDLQRRPAYLLSWEFPVHEDGPTGLSRHTVEAALDSTLQVVRTTTCLPADDRPCDTRSTNWPDVPHGTWFGYGLPVTTPPGSPGRVDHADGSVDVDRLHYAPGRLLPDFVDLTSTAGPEWLKLKEYRAGPALPPIDPWPALPEPLANATADWTMFPGEGEDLFGAGWTPLDALAELRKDPEAAAILDGGGCVVSFGADHRPDRSATAPALRRDGGSADFMLQDAQGRSTRWALYLNNGLTGLADMGWSAPQREDGWPMESDRTCAEMAAGPAPRLDARQAFDATASLLPMDGRGLWLRVSRQPGDHGHGGWTPLAIGLEFEVVVWPEHDASPTLPTQPARETHGYGRGATLDALRGTLVRLHTPGDGGLP